MAGGQLAGLFGDYETVVYSGESGPKGPLAGSEESLMKSILAARKLVSYQALAASIDRIICQPVSFPQGSSLYRPGNYVYKITKEKENASKREDDGEEYGCQ